MGTSQNGLLEATMEMDTGQFRNAISRSVPRLPGGEALVIKSLEE
jgi:hypothetical protein